MLGREDAGSALQQQGPLQLAERLQRFCSDEVGPEVGTLQAPMDARTATRNAVRAALMLWVWVDVRCSGFAAQVCVLAWRPVSLMRILSAALLLVKGCLAILLCCLHAPADRCIIRNLRLMQGC